MVQLSRQANIEDTFSACFIDNNVISDHKVVTMTILYLRWEDVMVYNENNFKTKFAPAKRILMILNTNAIKTHNSLTWLNNTKLGQLHHVVVDTLVMFTSNVMIAKKLLIVRLQRWHWSIWTTMVWSQPWYGHNHWCSIHRDINANLCKTSQFSTQVYI